MRERRMARKLLLMDGTLCSIWLHQLPSLNVHVHYCTLPYISPSLYYPLLAQVGGGAKVDEGTMSVAVDGRIQEAQNIRIRLPIRNTDFNPPSPLVGWLGGWGDPIPTKVQKLWYSMFTIIPLRLQLSSIIQYPAFITRSFFILQTKVYNEHDPVKKLFFVATSSAL